MTWQDRPTHAGEWHRRGGNGLLRERAVVRVYVGQSAVEREAYPADCEWLPIPDADALAAMMEAAEIAKAVAALDLSASGLAARLATATDGEMESLLAFVDKLRECGKRIKEGGADEQC